MHNCLTYQEIKTIHSSIQHVHHNSLDIKYNGEYNCRDEIDKNTYLVRNSSRNQLRRCNVPPNHRPVCSLISQQHCHPRAGYDSPRNKEQAGLHIAKDTQIIQANTVGFIRPSANHPSQHCWVYQAINKSAKPTQLVLSGHQQ